jgi:hypothetical protein
MDDETVDSLLSKVAAILEEHVIILASHRQYIEQLFKEISQIKIRLEKLETSASDKSDDTISVTEMTARLKAISDSLRTKD